MKKISILLLLVLSTLSVAYSQRAPRGMNYQAVARNLSGDVLADQAIELKINLASQVGKGATVHFSEIHQVRTNKLGLFTLVIGEGRAEAGIFNDVPWSTDDIWMEVSIRDESSNRFTPVSSSKLLAVPYAIHAQTASEVIGTASGRGIKLPRELGEKGALNRDPTDFPYPMPYTIPSEIQSTSPTNGALIVPGGVGIAKNLNVGGDGRFYNNLTVDKNLTVNGTVNFSGPSGFSGKLNVSDPTQSTTIATGAVTVTGGVGIGKNLNVGGNGDVDGTLNADGATTLKNTLNVNGNTDLDGTLNVDGTSSLTGALTVNDKITSKTLLVNSDNANYLAEFRNTNTTDGDGLKIKLGRNHPAWNPSIITGNTDPNNPSNYLNVTIPQLQVLDASILQVKEWIYGRDTFSPDDLLDLSPAGLVAGTACALTNRLSGALNTALGLPRTLPEIAVPSFTAFPGFGFGGVDLPSPIPDVPGFEIPGVTIPKTVLLPASTVVPAIPQINCAALGLGNGFTFPNITLSDVDNSLSNKNEFLSFRDKDDRRLGSVRAQSVSDFSISLDAAYLADFAANMIALDPLGIVMGFTQNILSLSKRYNNIGVEYSSGNGDYAEWLERVNPAELISAGDIVGVRGGKISKDLTGAEQVMAVSHRPIVLGNMPLAGKEGLGNQIAFMGQIPVKVMGPVRSGDYIVARGNVTGYGVAVSAAQMTPDDFRLVVGRSWEERLTEGPKAVNTVVGVHNGDYLKLLKKQQDKVDGMEARLTALELRLNRAASAANTPAGRERKTLASAKK